MEKWFPAAHVILYVCKPSDGFRAVPGEFRIPMRRRESQTLWLQARNEAALYVQEEPGNHAFPIISTAAREG